MGEKDTSEKMLADYNDVFADIVNVLLFDGKRIIDQDSLKSTKAKSQYKAAGDNKIHEMERDNSKYWMEGNVKIALYGSALKGKFYSLPFSRNLLFPHISC